MKYSLTLLQDYFPNFGIDYALQGIQSNKDPKYVEFKKVIKNYNVEEYEIILYPIWVKIFTEWYKANTNKRFAESPVVNPKHHDKLVDDLKIVLLQGKDVNVDHIQLSYKDESGKLQIINLDNKMLLKFIEKELDFMNNLKKLQFPKYSEFIEDKPRIKSFEKDFVKEWLCPLHRLLNEEKGLNLFSKKIEARRFICDFCGSFGFNIEEDYLKSTFKKCRDSDS